MPQLTAHNCAPLAPVAGGCNGHCVDCAMARCARHLAAELTSAKTGCVDMQALTEVVDRHVLGTPAASAFSEAFVGGLASWTEDEIVNVLMRLPPSARACANALRAWPRLAFHVGRVDQLEDGIVHVLSGNCSAYAVERMIAAIPPDCMTAKLASRLATADFRALEHFTPRQAQRAGAKTNAHMYTVVDVAAIRQCAVERSLVRQRTVLEAAWACPAFASVAKFVAARGDSVGLASSAHLGGWRRVDTFADQVRARFFLSFAEVCDASSKCAPCAPHGINRRTLRWFASYGDVPSYARIGKRALEQNSCEALFLWAMRRCDDALHPAVHRVAQISRTADPTGGAEARCARLMARLLWQDAAPSTLAAQRFVQSTCWRLGIDHVTAALDFVALPFVKAGAWRLGYVRSHKVVGAMPPSVHRWLCTVLLCLGTRARDQAVQNMVLSFVPWSATHKRAWERCSEHMMADFNYT